MKWRKGFSGWDREDELRILNYKLQITNEWQMEWQKTKRYQNKSIAVELVLLNATFYITSYNAIAIIFYLTMISCLRNYKSIYL